MDGLSNYPNVDWETFASFYKQSEAALHALQQLSIRAYAKSFDVSVDEAKELYSKLYENELAKPRRTS